MGQKVNPIGLRLGIVKTWESRWFGGKNYAQYILEDHKLRTFIKKKLYHAGVSRVEIERSSKRVRLRIYTSRPGIVIGKKGSEISQLKKDVEKMTTHEVLIDIQEIRKPEVDAQLVAEGVAQQLERRVDMADLVAVRQDHDTRAGREALQATQLDIEIADVGARIIVAVAEKSGPGPYQYLTG